MGRRKVKPEAPSRAHVHLSWLHAAVRFLHPEREEAARSFVARNKTIILVAFLGFAQKKPLFLPVDTLNGIEILCFVPARF
ncbi:MAG TPA: hypothetical protein EYO39_06910 [Nitrospirales bacterium]|nr:hypothetical protein [Nitrospirales bacterium]